MSTISSIPVIDFNPWHTGSRDDKKKVARDLADACKNVGFVSIVNHGVPDELVVEAFSWSKKLFRCSVHRTKEIGSASSGGYSWPRLEKLSQYIHQEGDDEHEKDKELRQIQDFKESYEIGSEDFTDQANVWLPEAILPSFRTFTTSFYYDLFKVATQLLQANTVGIGLDDEDYFLKFHGGLSNQLRLLHYPPVETEKLEKDVLVRMPAHSDWCSITLLFQDAVGGLQVENPNVEGKFVDVKPLKGGLVMNVGDFLMRWSNDHLKPTLHQVTLPPVRGNEGMTKARYSIPYFVVPDPQAVVECLRVCVDGERPVKYPAVTQREYCSLRAKMQYSSN